MKFEKTITMAAYKVEYIDQRQPKPRTVHRELIVLDGGKLPAIERLGLRPAGFNYHQAALETVERLALNTENRLSTEQRLITE